MTIIIIALTEAAYNLHNHGFAAPQFGATTLNALEQALEYGFIRLRRAELQNKMRIVNYCATTRARPVQHCHRRCLENYLFQ